MDLRFFNSFKFLRRYFNLPGNKKLKWGIVEESHSSEDAEFRLCVLICGTDKYIDIAARRIFSQANCRLIKRLAVPAKRLSAGKEYAYIADNGWLIRLPKTFIADVYRSSWWRTGETEKARLL